MSFDTNLHRFHIGSYMIAHFLLNLLNELRKSDKMRDLSSILSLFPMSLINSIQYKSTMLDSIYHMTLKLIENRFLAFQTSKFCHLLRNIMMDVITSRYEICISNSLHAVISLQDDVIKNMIIFYSDIQIMI